MFLIVEYRVLKNSLRDLMPSLFAIVQHKISPIVEMTYVNHMLPFLLVISTIGENFCIPHHYTLIELNRL